MENERKGYQTSEFWITAVVTLAGMAVAGGMLNPADGQAVTTGVQLIADGIGKVVAGATMVAPVVWYSYQRTRIKIESMRLSSGRPPEGS